MEIDLSGTWQVTLNGRDVPCALPGDIHSALLDRGLIPDPYFASNEDAVRWMMERDWVLSRTVSLSAEQAASMNQIELDRVDTLATVRINGVDVGRCDNAFRRWRFAVDEGVLKAGDNHFELAFDNPVAAAKALSQAQEYDIPWHWNVDLPHANLIRMIACDCGWDWNICLTPLGVAGALVLRRAPTLSLDYLDVRQRHSAGKVDLVLTVSGTLYDRDGVGSCAGTLVIDGQTLALSPEPVDGGEFRAVARCTLDQPRLWWPNGMGKQALYSVQVALDGQGLTRTIGLRSLEIDQTEDSTGSAMQFVVNGQPIFAKGAKRAGDEIWDSRYFMMRLCEKYDVTMDLTPKPFPGDWNGSGMHANFSNTTLRTCGSKDVYDAVCQAFEPRIKHHIDVYGADNDQRLTGLQWPKMP